MPPQVIDEQIVELPPKVTVGFERSIKVRDYETAKASVFIQAEVPNDATDDQREAGIRDAFFQAKSLVFDELGIEFSTDENSVVREAVERQLGPTTEVKQFAGRSSAPRGSRGKQATVPAENPAAPSEPTTTASKPIVRDTSCEKCGDPNNKFWDNRADKAEGKVKANYPDWKCAEKSCRAGIWDTPKGS